MNKKLFTLAATATLALSAAAAWAASGWTASASVTGVYAGYPDGSVYVRGLENKAVCTSTLIHFHPSTSDPELVQRIALSAFLSGKKLACNVSGCVDGYQSGRQCKIEN